MPVMGAGELVLFLALLRVGSQVFVKEDQNGKEGGGVDPDVNHPLLPGGGGVQEKSRPWRPRLPRIPPFDSRRAPPRRVITPIALSPLRIHDAPASLSFLPCIFAFLPVPPSDPYDRNPRLCASAHFDTDTSGSEFAAVFFCVLGEFEGIFTLVNTVGCVVSKVNTFQI